MSLKRYFGDRAFYKMTLTVALPIMAQNFITNLVSMLDNLMVGALGTEPVSGVSIVNQIMLIFHLAVFGAMSGIGIFTAQYYGRGDNEGIRYTLRFKFLTALGIFAAALAIFLCFDDALIGLFLHASDAEGDLAATLDYARVYLQIILLGLLPFALTQVFADTLRETGDTFTPMVAGLTAVGVNCLFNYLLIFGKLGFPEMGVRGAAAATSLSRWVEFLLIIIYIIYKRARFPYMRGAFRSLRVPARLAGRFAAKGAPLLLNEILWSAGESALGVAFSLNGLAVVAGHSISSTVFNLFCIASMSMGSSIGIIAGKSLGAGKHDEAVDQVRKLITFSMLISLFVGALMFAVGGLIPRLYNISEESRAMAAYFIRVNAFVMPLAAFANASYFTVRSGGKTVVTFFFDCGILWSVSVSLAFLLHYAFHLDIHWLYPIVQGSEIIKDIVGYVLIRKRVWVKTIV